MYRLFNLFYLWILKPILFRVDPETAHSFMLKVLRVINSSKFLCRILKKIAVDKKILRDSGPSIIFDKTKTYPELLSWLQRKYRVGLAAGFDKNAEVIHAMDALGFGFIEVGTVTIQPQEGNTHRPRMYRFPDRKALINQLGFPNKGMEYVYNNVKAAKDRDPNLIIGINLGKNKDTPLHLAYEEYKILSEKFGNIADYLVINISSPNTQGLRELQQGEYLNQILSHISHHRKTFLKISPDLTEEELETVVDLALKYNLLGLIVSNTTIQKTGTHSLVPGGLSGQPLYRIMTKTLRRVRELSHGKKLAIIASGGIDNKYAFRAAVDEGAHLVQVYTPMIYQGPTIVSQLLK